MCQKVREYFIYRDGVRLAHHCFSFNIRFDSYLCLRSVPPPISVLSLYFLHAIPRCVTVTINIEHSVYTSVPG